MADRISLLLTVYQDVGDSKSNNKPCVYLVLVLSSQKSIQIYIFPLNLTPNMSSQSQNITWTDHFHRNCIYRDNIKVEKNRSRLLWEFNPLAKQEWASQPQLLPLGKQPETDFSARSVWQQTSRPSDPHTTFGLEGRFLHKQGWKAFFTVVAKGLLLFVLCFS